MSDVVPYVSHQPQIARTCFVHASAYVMGAVTLHDDVSVWPMSVLRGDVQTIEIGPRSNLQDGVVVHVASDHPHCPGGIGVVLGEGVTVGHRAIIHACHIGSYCLVGMGAIVMDGVVCEDHVMIGAGTVVTPGQHLKSGTLWLGSPARYVRDLTETERQALVYSADHYVAIKNAHVAQ